jgi:hypothetical protein
LRYADIIDPFSAGDPDAEAALFDVNFEALQLGRRQSFQYAGKQGLSDRRCSCGTNLYVEPLLKRRSFGVLMPAEAGTKLASSMIARIAQPTNCRVAFIKCCARFFSIRFN